MANKTVKPRAAGSPKPAPQIQISRTSKKPAPARRLAPRRAAMSAEPQARPARAHIERYDPKAIESRWQARWEADKLHRAVIDRSRPKYYALTMLPYPSGDLHI